MSETVMSRIIRQAIVSASEVEPWPDLNPRMAFDEAELAELEASVRVQGVRQPVAVHDRGEGKRPRYWLVAGERRWRVARRTGAQLPIAISEYTLAEAIEVALIENLQRANLNPIEEARAFQKRLDLGDVTATELAERLGVSQPHVSNRVGLLRLPKQVQELIANGAIKASYARDMLMPWLREDEAVSRRFFRVLGDHLAMQVDMNEPFTKAFLAGVVSTIGNAVKPSAVPQAARASAAPERPEPAARPDPAPASEQVAIAPEPPAAPVATPATVPEPTRPAESPVAPETVSPSPPMDPEPEAASPGLITRPATGGVVETLSPLLSAYDIDIQVYLLSAAGNIGVEVTPRRKQAHASDLMPRLIGGSTGEIDGLLLTALRALVGEFESSAA